MRIYHNAFFVKNKMLRNSAIIVIPEIKTYKSFTSKKTEGNNSQYTSDEDIKPAPVTVTGNVISSTNTLNTFIDHSFPILEKEGSYKGRITQDMSFILIIFI